MTHSGDLSTDGDGIAGVGLAQAGTTGAGEVLTILSGALLSTIPLTAGAGEAAGETTSL